MNGLAKIIAAVIGAIVSVAVEIVPGLKELWSAWRYKPLVLFGLSLAVPFLLFVLHCYAGITFYQFDDCATQTLIDAVLTGFVGFMGSQTTYAIGACKLPNATARNS